MARIAVIRRYTEWTRQVIEVDDPNDEEEVQYKKQFSNAEEKLLGRDYEDSYVERIDDE